MVNKIMKNIQFIPTYQFESYIEPCPICKGYACVKYINLNKNILHIECQDCGKLKEIEITKEWQIKADFYKIKKERDILAKKLADLCYEIYSMEEVDRWWFDSDWLNWADKESYKE